MNFIISAGAVIVVLGIMILVHEWGHFIAARSFGVRVDIFSFGFGPRLWGRKRGDTDYRVSLLPLGGYVKMAGDNPTEERAGAPDEFLSKPRWQRCIIALAGPVMNLITAVVVFWVLFVFLGAPKPTYIEQPADVVVVPTDSAAARAGLQPGDRIVAVGGTASPTWEAAYRALASLPLEAPVGLLVERDGQRRELSVAAQGTRRASDIFGYANLPPVIGDVASGFPAQRAGLRRGDRIVAVDGRHVVAWQQVTEVIWNSEGREVELTILRDGQETPLRVKPAWTPNADGNMAWQIGMVNDFQIVFRRLGVVPGAVQAVGETSAWTVRIVGIVVKLVTGDVSLKHLQGVVGIARESGEAVKRGPMEFLNLMAVISLNLGILNLLPIPILDGGHILMLAVEGTIRRDLSVRLKERFVQVGLVFLLVIITYVMYNDIVRLVK